MYPYHHVKKGGVESLTVFMPSGPPIVATAEHPHFADLLEGARSDLDADELRGLADLSVAVAERFESLSERVSVANGRVYFDGDEVDSTITRQIVRCLEDPSAGDWKPLVLFMENVAANPNAHSREQLFDWLRDREFTIVSNGNFIAYKGVSSRDEDGDDYGWESSGTGSAIVNGEAFSGRIPNALGATVEMPRGDVQHDPEHGCSTGLHVGTYEYAKGYASAALLTVLVNPRDVVSVPTDCNAEKMRVCRYTVADDDPTHPSEGPAIEAGREPTTLYPNPYPNATPGSLEDTSFPTDFYVKSGEFRPPCEGELYLYEEGTPEESIGRAFGDYMPDEPETILVPTEPQHGDWTRDDGEGRFYLDCQGDTGWRHTLGRDRATFLAEHEDCEAY